MAKKSIPKDHGLRLGTKNSVSCGTTSFILGFDTKKSGDDSFFFEGIDILIKKKELLHLMDITLDYVETEEVAGFRFEKSIA